MCALFFEPQGEGVHRCKICGADRKQLPGTGYSNLLSPLSSRHEDFRAQYNAQNRDTDRLLQDFGFVSEAIYQRYQWLWWVVVRGMPLSEVDDELTRAMSKWQPTNSKAVKADMITVATKLGAVITEEMGIVFGVMCDGWTHGIMHFVAIYGQYVVGGQLRRTLLVMSPPDERSRDGDAHIALLRNVLAVYNKTIDVILFLVADNCSTNHSIANKLGIPLVGCASHRFNLAVKKFLTEHEDLLHQVNNLMLQLHQQKNGAELFMLTPLRPKKRNVTRWSSTYNPVQGYGAIRPQSRLVEAVEDLVPSTGDHKKLVGLLKHLEKLDSVCKRLQCETTTMSETFRGKRKERQDSYAAQIIQQGGAKRRQVERAVYSPLATPVPPTLNTCERFFTECKMILTPQRSCMLLAHFEMLMFLRANNDMWDVTSLA
ncbi:hypothetical protein PC129_g17089 [Phytophthora cactorum]|uniref:Uncharacterized protein n=1 Tax=Phytophthora cactorum TaxID=29920 RepID=A0A8T1F358_9STRA|nr:hypothetical protein PC112_g20646 [Phytophthora cactorum]KAG2800199.1 hypothetical protein PC111_g20070 [Phytophthora cactorum]KAG2879336.1 hypothetical protein PC114_g22618 [Phytophthora cactorum]KAG2888164.1 hypothetical protein PC115_g20137 [Phytophthora cactorum]KAG2899465.1 hypothetical protein PC117_g22218 [Phytophthora cactorum]